MTDAELLQQCKDEVAQNHSMDFKKWEDLVQYYVYEYGSSAMMFIDKHADNAATLAIQKAREEAYRDGYFDSGRHWPHRYSTVHKHDCSRCGKTGVSFCNVYRCEVMEKIINPDQKLTAPGR